MAYYYSGCASWSWYFPYHYAPCVSTLLELDNFKFSFELGRPLSPIEQLMAVWRCFFLWLAQVQPPSCSYLVPKACAALMTEEDSPLREFYPKTVLLISMSAIGIDHLWYRRKALQVALDCASSVYWWEEIVPLFWHCQRHFYTWRPETKPPRRCVLDCMHLIGWC